MRRAARRAWGCWAVAAACQTPAVLLRWWIGTRWLAPIPFRMAGVQDIGGRQVTPTTTVHPDLWGSGIRIEWIVLAVGTAWAFWRVAWSLTAMLTRPPIPRGIAKTVGWRRPLPAERRTIDETLAPLRQAAEERGLPWRDPRWWVIDRHGWPGIERVGGTLIAEVDALDPDPAARAARTAQVAAAAGALASAPVAGLDPALLRLLARRTALRGAALAGQPIEAPGLDAAWRTDDGRAAAQVAAEGAEGLIRKTVGWVLFIASGGWGLGLLADLGAGEAAEQAAVLDADRWAVELGAGPELLEWLHLAAPVLDRPAPWRWVAPPATAERREVIEDALLSP